MTDDTHACPNCGTSAPEFGSGFRCPECDTVFSTGPDGRVDYVAGRANARELDTDDVRKNDITDLRGLPDQNKDYLGFEKRSDMMKRRLADAEPNEDDT